MTDPSHTIESTQPVWAAIEASPPVRALFIDAAPWCWWCSNKVQIRILDRNAAAAAHTLGSIAPGQEPGVIEGLQRLAWACHEIATKKI